VWQVLIDHFRRFPAQERVVRLLIHHGLRIHDGKVYAGAVEISDTAVARAADVDRRIVRATVETVAANPQLERAFSRFQSTLHLKDVAPAMGLGVLQIVASNASQPGILAGVSAVIAEAGLSVRQAIVEDPEFTDEPNLFVITEAPVPGSLIPLLQRVRGVKSVTVRSADPPAAPPPAGSTSGASLLRLPRKRELVA
jgi:uncharacterized protein